MEIWRIAPGDPPRAGELGTLFLKHGLVAVGGEDWEETQKRQTNDWAGKLYHRVNIGDQILLKAWGRQDLLWAIGRVIGECKKHGRLVDVDGWDVSITRAVEWFLPPGSCFGPQNDWDIEGVEHVDVGPGALDRRAIVPGANDNLRSLANSVVSDSQQTGWIRLQSMQLEQSEPRKLDRNGLRDNLLDAGITSALVDEILRLFERMRDLWGFYCRNCETRGEASEHEVIAYLVVPFLRTLGYSEQSVAIEWKRIDVAVFGRDERTRSMRYEPSHLRVLIEVKRPLSGLGDARKQVEAYATQYPDCKVIVVTDGLRYKIHAREGDRWPPVAYLSVVDRWASHPYLKGVGGAVQAIQFLMP